MTTTGMKGIKYDLEPTDYSIIVSQVAINNIVFATHYMGNGWLRVNFGNHSGYMYREFLLLRSIIN